MHAMLALDDVAPYVISHLDLADIFRLRHVLGAAFYDDAQVLAVIRARMGLRVHGRHTISQLAIRMREHKSRCRQCGSITSRARRVCRPCEFSIDYPPSFVAQVSRTRAMYIIRAYAKQLSERGYANIGERFIMRVYHSLWMHVPAVFPPIGPYATYWRKDVLAALPYVASWYVSGYRA